MNKQETTLLQLLRVPSNLPLSTQRSRMNARLHALGHSDPCSRCGGSGNYSFNMMDGSRCYGCGGFGAVAPKLTDDLVARVKDSVDNGHLDNYLQGLKVIHEATTSPVRVMEAWAAAIHGQYDWVKAANGIEPDLSLSRINAQMKQAYDEVSALFNKLQGIGFKLKKAKTQEDRRTLEQERVDVAMALKSKEEESLKVIANLKEQIPAVLNMSNGGAASTD